MKAFISNLHYHTIMLLLSTAFIPVIFSSCDRHIYRRFTLEQHILSIGGSANGVAHSPIKPGYGINITSGFQPENSKTAFLALLSYSRFRLGGGDGSSNYFQIGPQVRHFFQKEHHTGFFAGGEITYLRTVLKYNDVSFKSYSNGYTIGGIAGYEIKSGVLSVYFAPAFMHRGAFVTLGESDNDPANGFFGKIGVDIHLMSLVSKKSK